MHFICISPWSILTLLAVVLSREASVFSPLNVPSENNHCRVGGYMSASSSSSQMALTYSVLRKIKLLHVCLIFINTMMYLVMKWLDHSNKCFMSWVSLFFWYFLAQSWLGYECSSFGIISHLWDKNFPLILWWSFELIFMLILLNYPWWVLSLASVTEKTRISRELLAMQVSILILELVREHFVI